MECRKEDDKREDSKAGGSVRKWMRQKHSPRSVLEKSILELSDKERGKHEKI